MKINDTTDFSFDSDMWTDAKDYYVNDDMEVSIIKTDTGYTVQFYSYDGTINFEDTYTNYGNAKALFLHIQTHYAHTQPETGAVENYAKRLHRHDKKPYIKLG